MTIVVLGRSGQLASHLRELLPQAQFWGREQQDLSRLDTFETAVRQLHPECIINAAAYTAVDKAESEPDIAWRINVDAVAAMARSAQALNIPLLHISSDYVFDGRGTSAHDVDDPVAPLSVYGATKLAGELAVRSLCDKYWVLRTSWVFSEYGANFVKTMLRLGRERSSLSVVNDQTGIPTYAGHIAQIIARVVNALPERPLATGTYHVCGGRAVSWHEFAEQVFLIAREKEILKQAVAVNPIPTSAYPTPAVRPANSVLSVSPEIESVLNFRCDWMAGLEEMLSRISED